MTAFQKKLWIGLLIMALMTPLGILLPRLFRAEGAWGEWGADQVEKLIGYVPQGFKRLADLWKAPLSDYQVGGDDSSVAFQVLSYMISGLIGVGACALVFLLVSKWIAKTKHGK